ncbi:MAG: hypothetical protein RL199_1948 [Pseudomonadota bacterium]|jgi:hypothetical protein
MALLLASTPPCSEGPPLLAVLDFHSPDEALGEGEFVTLTDAVRSVIVKELGSRYKVLARETMREVVPPEKMRCSANMCAADIGRMLQAPVILVGEVRRFAVSHQRRRDEWRGQPVRRSRRRYVRASLNAAGVMSSRARPKASLWVPSRSKAHDR